MITTIIKVVITVCVSYTIYLACYELRTSKKRTKKNNKALWNALENHIGHNVEIVSYGKSIDNPSSICLECTDCNEIILDAELYTLQARKDVDY